MRASSSVIPSLLAASLVVSGCVGLEAGSTYPDYSSSDVRKQLVTPENREDPSISLGRFKIKSSACADLDTSPVSAKLAQHDFTRFLEAQGVQKPFIKARGNLYWYDLPGDDKDEKVRLRLAVLDSPDEAADELHRSLLEHGPGWWGIRRSNLAVLAPKAGVTEAMAFALKYKLVCWGVFAMTDVDDVYVVPGPYAEL
jgi:hypothetical protein